MSHWQGDITFSNSFTWQDEPLHKAGDKKKKNSLHKPGDLSCQCVISCEDWRSMPFHLTDGLTWTDVSGCWVTTICETHVRGWEHSNPPWTPLTCNTTPRRILHVCVCASSRGRETSDTENILTGYTLDPHLCYHGPTGHASVCILTLLWPWARAVCLVTCACRQV